MTLGIIFLSLLLYIRWRNLRFESQVLDAKFLLYGLRDKLRLYAIDDKIDKENWSFHYLDSSICKTIREIEWLNIWTLGWLTNKHKSDATVNLMIKALERAAADNSYVNDINQQFIAIMGGYIIKRHYLIELLLWMGFHSKRAEKSVERSAKSVSSLPETSSVNSYIVRDHEVVQRGKFVLAN